MKLKYLLIILIALVIILIGLVGISIYDNYKIKSPKDEMLKEQKHTVEEIVEPVDIPVEDKSEVPTTEEPGKNIPILNEVTVVIKNLHFYPKEITISPGTKVIWFNNDTSPHKVVAYDRLFYGDRLGSGETYEFTFTKEGTHPYFDAIFPKIGRGKITVKEEPLPITASVIGIDLNKEETNAKFALLVVLFVIMVLGIAHGIYTHRRI